MNRDPKTLFWKVVAGLFAFLTLFIFLSWNGWLGYMPSLEELEDPKSNLATEVYSSDQQLIGKMYIQNRSVTRYDELSPYLVQALTATEDERFYQHSGIDYEAMLRAITFLGSKGGGSTITQQLAKNMFHGVERTNIFNRVYQKFKEMIISIKLERRFTKEEIIALYFTTVEFGNNAFGIRTASRTFFNKEPKDLTLVEAATLVGMLKASTLYNPKRNPERSLQRRNVVLKQMKKNGFLTEAQLEEAKALPMNVDYAPETHREGMATHFREYLRKQLMHKKPNEDDYFFEGLDKDSIEYKREYARYQADLTRWEKNPLEGWCLKNKKPNGDTYNVYKDGLRIYTTIDSRMQTYAEEAVQESMTKLQKEFNDHWRNQKLPWDTTSIYKLALKRTDRYQTWKDLGKDWDEIYKLAQKPVKTTLFSWNGKIDTTISVWDSIRYSQKILQSAMLAMEVGTGQIKAWVGGINFEHSQYDHVNIGAKRQVGSTFKPLVYAAALELGEDPCQQIPNQPVTFPDFENWTPKNADGSIGGYYTMFSGLARSVNNIVAHFMKKIGPQIVIDYAKKLGITSFMDAVPSLCLGSFEISLVEMVGAYGAFPNGGEWVEPMYITRIEDKNGNVLADFTPKVEEVYDENTAFITTQLLQGVCRRGTGGSIWAYSNCYVGGKTGTTNENADGWFMGITPRLVVGCWTGAEDRRVRFRSTQLGGGSHSALPQVGRFLGKVYADKDLGYENRDFEVPKGFRMEVLNCANRGMETIDTSSTIEAIENVFE